MSAEGALIEGRERPRLWLLGVALAVLSFVRLVVDVLSGARLLEDHPSGAWATLADDLLHGVLYRPVESGLGWGGTRYPPLYVVLRAAVARTGLPLDLSGQLLDGTALVALVLITVRILRELGVTAGLARSAALVGLALVPVQLLLGLGKADLVATALSLGGVLLALRRRSLGAGALFGLAVLVKWTVVFGLVASLHHALAGGRRRAAALLLAAAGGVVGAGVTLGSIASDGRLLAQLRACAAGGGTFGSRIFQVPHDFLSYADPADHGLVLVAAAALVITRPAAALPRRLLTWTLLGTLAVFLSPGIAENHLLDLDLAAWIALTVCIDSPALPRRLGTLALVSLAGWSLARMAPEAIQGPRNVRMAELRPELGSPAAGPLLAENPWIPLQLGERPVLLDAFTFRILSAADPGLMTRLTDDLARGRFRAVVLRRPPDDPGGRIWYRETHFGPGFVEALEASYQRVASHRVEPWEPWRLEVWRPRGGGR